MVSFPTKKIVKKFNPIAVIQYGSSVYQNKYRDIDIAIIGNYKAILYINKFEIHFFHKEDLERLYRVFIFPYRVLYENGKLDEIIKNSMNYAGRKMFLGFGEGEKTINREKFIRILQVGEAIISGYLNNRKNCFKIPRRTLDILPEHIQYKKVNLTRILTTGIKRYIIHNPKFIFEYNIKRDFIKFTYNITKFLSFIKSFALFQIEREEDLILKVLYNIKRKLLM